MPIDLLAEKAQPKDLLIQQTQQPRDLLTEKETPSGMGQGDWHELYRAPLRLMEFPEQIALQTAKGEAEEPLPQWQQAVGMPWIRGIKRAGEYVIGERERAERPGILNMPFIREATDPLMYLGWGAGKPLAKKLLGMGEELPKAVKVTPSMLRATPGELTEGLAFSKPAYNKVMGVTQRWLVKEDAQKVATWVADHPDELLSKSILKDPPREDVVNALSRKVLGYGAKQSGQTIKSTTPPFMQAFQAVRATKPGKVASFIDKTKRAFAPGTRGEEAAFASGTVREMGGRIAYSDARAESTFSQARSLLGGRTPEEQFQFLDFVEGRTKDIHPELAQAATDIKIWADQSKAALLKAGVGAEQHWIDNYFPHLWRDPVEAREILDTYYRQQASLMGAKSFLKVRKIPSIQEGIQLGLKPLYNNPIDNILARNHEMAKFISGQQSVSSLKDAGYLKFIKVGQPRPAGLVLIDDRISTVYAPLKEGGFRVTGHWYAPEKVATIFNRYLSPGLTAKFPTTFGLYRNTANLLNQFQLSLSAFHAGFTTLDVATSRAALALNQLARGEIGKAMQSAVSVPVEPILNVIRGDRFLRSALNPTLHPELQPIIEALQMGGGRLKMEQFYRTGMTRKMLDSWRTGGITGKIASILRVPGAAVEQVTKPILEWLVPRQKLGLFNEMMKYELERRPDMTAREVRAVAGRIVDSLDNRLGQLTYDNLHWDNVAKDLALASVRSVGWGVGTIREVGGGLYDLGKAATQIVRGKTPELSYRAAYTIALPTIVGTLGGIINYVMTGESPKEMLDYYFPRTGELDVNGNPQRISLPSYMKDIQHYSTEPVQTVLGKIHPLVGMVGDILHNMTFGGTEIIHRGDDLGKQFFDALKYATHLVTPLSIKGMQRLIPGRPVGTGVEVPLIGTVPTTPREWLPQIGVLPAPSKVTMTPAQELASYYVGKRFPSRTMEQAERRDILKALKMRTEKGESVSEEGWKALGEGRITRSQWKGLFKPPVGQLIANFKRLPYEDAERVWAECNPQEKQLLAVVRLKKRTAWLREHILGKPAEIEVTPQEEPEIREIEAEGE
jgi:hypothetical protein